MPKLTGRLIKVEYVGHSDGITTEYNGKKYAFTKRRPISILPVEVYDYIKSTGGQFVNDLVPVGESSVSEEERDNSKDVTNSAPETMDESEKEEEKGEEITQKKSVKPKKFLKYINN